MRHGFAPKYKQKPLRSSRLNPTFETSIHAIKTPETMRTAVFPGSFDPITKGHEELVRRAIPLFDKIIVAIGVNSQKKYLFPLEQRLAWLELVFKNAPSVEVARYEGLTAHYCRDIGAEYLLRGLRSATDFDYEKNISQLNAVIGGGLETVFLISEPQYSHFSSTIVREIIKGGADASPFLPDAVEL
jgi:pantetheine-phosphate adenylyltransferase